MGDVFRPAAHSKSVPRDTANSREYEVVSKKTAIFAVVCTAISISAIVLILVFTFEGLSNGVTSKPNSTSRNILPIDPPESQLKEFISGAISELEAKFEERLSNITLEEGPRGEKGEDGKCVGVLGGNRLYINGRMGWKKTPIVDNMATLWSPVKAKIGDILVFETNTDKSNQDLWLMSNRTAYNACDFETAVLLADSQALRPGVGGYEYPLSNEALAGRTLFFASRRKNSCDSNRIKVEVYIDSAAVIEVGVGDVADSETVRQLETVIAALSENAIMMQTAMEQRVRSQGSSGLTRVRGYDGGIKSYLDASYSRTAVGNIHNHANNINTMGMGEIMAVLNGVEFQTRHNDYKLLMPHRNSTEYHATEPIPFPEVPPEVLEKPTVEDQVKEMQAWFKAWKDQDWSVRDYRQYFRPVLSYIEGTWITDTKNFTEPFESDRHKIDADTWRELHEKFQYLLNSGRKNNLENLAFLPSSVRSMRPDGKFPVLANWEYRIACHPLREDVPLQRLRVAQDLHVQLWQRPTTKDELYYTRRARFEVNPSVGNEGDATYPTLDDMGQQSQIEWDESMHSWGYLDYLMEQVPGKDNYMGDLEENLEWSLTMHHERTAEVLNAAYYSRFYNMLKRDAMGLSKRRRSFSDQYMWAARTIQPKVSALEFNDQQIVDPDFPGCLPKCKRKDFYRSTR